MRLHEKWMVAVLGAVLVWLTPAAYATEGGGSHYLPGTYNDFAAGVFGPSGLYFRNDFFPHHGVVSRAPIGGRLYRDVDERIWSNSFKIALVSDARIFGGRYGAALAIPLVLHQRAEGFLQLNPGQTRQRDNRSGLGDINMTPLQLNWRSNNHHLTLGESIFAPTGSYDRERVINLGRNYWGFDSTATYTWLDEQRGHEVSLTAGYLVNTENQRTDYRSGNEFHLDYLLAQHFSPRLAIGFPAYWYKQMSGDDARVLRSFNLGSFRGESAGVGLAMLFKPRIGGKDVNLTLKWVHDIYARRRIEGSEIMFAVSFKLWPWSDRRTLSARQRRAQE